MNNTPIPREFWGKVRGEEWYMEGMKDAMFGKPIRDKKEITRRRWGSLPGSLAWKAYEAGYKAQTDNKE